MARPTDYTPAICEQAQRYLEECTDEQYTQVKSDGKLGTTWENRVRVKLPTIEGLAFELHVHRDTLYEWEKLHDEFSDILTALRQKQADALIRNGLSGDYNPTIAKVLLTKHGYRDAADLTSGDKPLPAPIYAGQSVLNPEHNGDQESLSATQTD